jgi:hypothetical protein
MNCEFSNSENNEITSKYPANLLQISIYLKLFTRELTKPCPLLISLTQHHLITKPQKHPLRPLTCKPIPAIELVWIIPEMQARARELRSQAPETQGQRKYAGS